MRIFHTCALICIVLAGCARRTADESKWLVSTPEDTLTVAEAAGLWASLAPGEAQAFLGGEEPGLEFAEALAGRLALEALVESSGAADHPQVDAHTSSWLRIEASMAARRVISAGFTAEVTPGDIEFFRENQGVHVRFSIDGTPVPVSFILAELPRETALALAAAEIGETVLLQDSGMITVDSVFTAAPADQGLTDSDIAGRIGNGRERFHYLTVLTGLMSDTSFYQYPSFDAVGTLARNTAVLACGDWTWTAEDLLYEATFLETRMPAIEISDEWRAMLVENLLMQSWYRDMLAGSYPLMAESIMHRAESYRILLASERLVQERMDSRVHVTSEDIEREYSLLIEPVITAERRVFAVAASNSGGLTSLAEALEMGRVPEGNPGLPALASPEGPGTITRALMRSELPVDIASTLFGIEPDDTTGWVGSFQLDHDLHAFFRLMEVRPPRAATADEILPMLTERARQRLEEIEMEAFLQELKADFEIQVNEALLELLSPNPALWLTE